MNIFAVQYFPRPSRVWKKPMPPSVKSKSTQSPETKNTKHFCLNCYSMLLASTPFLPSSLPCWLPVAPCLVHFFFGIVLFLVFYIFRGRLIVFWRSAARCRSLKGTFVKIWCIFLASQRLEKNLIHSEILRQQEHWCSNLLNDTVKT